VKKNEKMEQLLKEEQRMILEMIDASWEQAERLGKHELKNGCNCISCVNKRKRILEKREAVWKFNL